MKAKLALCLAAAALVSTGLALGAPEALAQSQIETPPPAPGARAVKIDKIIVHAPTIEGNLEGDSPDREVLVVLPPSYSSTPKRRYPVVYALHGYSIGVDQWTQDLHLPQTAEAAFAKGAREMILVLPDSQTIHNGSMYSSGITTGDFESFIARDLPRYIDAHYRTIARRESRGLTGHSMGGYGVARIGMRHAEMFGALYMMSPCCLSARTSLPVDPAGAAALEAAKSPLDSSKLTFSVRALMASAAAWSPNPTKPPLYLDLPVENGEVRADVLARWAANAPLAFVDQYVEPLRTYRAIAIDVGDKDRLKDDAARLHDALDAYRILNRFEVYSGTHLSRVAFRFQDEVIPFFSLNLAFPDAP